MNTLSTNTMNILILLLGCNIMELLNGRIDVAVDFARIAGDVDWFLSGGIKDGNGKERERVSEAQIMENQITTKNTSNHSWHFIKDTVAKNTAENFVIANRTVDFGSYENVYVVTSAFHYERARQMADMIIENNRFKWLLSNAELADSRYWEKIHLKNVKSDVKRAISSI